MTGPSDLQARARGNGVSNGGIPAGYQVDGRHMLSLQGADTLSLAAIERRPEWRDAWQQVMDWVVSSLNILETG